jgi:hypothetical protein
MEYISQANLSFPRRSFVLFNLAMFEYWLLLQQKIVIKVPMPGHKRRAKAMALVSGFAGMQIYNAANN